MAGALEGDLFVGPKAEEHRGLLSIRCVSLTAKFVIICVIFRLNTVSANCVL